MPSYATPTAVVVTLARTVKPVQHWHPVSRTDAMADKLIQKNTIKFEAAGRSREFGVGGWNWLLYVNNGYRF